MTSSLNETGIPGTHKPRKLITAAAYEPLFKAA